MLDDFLASEGFSEPGEIWPGGTSQVIFVSI